MILVKMLSSYLQTVRGTYSDGIFPVTRRAVAFSPKPLILLTHYMRRRCGTTSAPEDPTATPKKRELLSPTAELADPYPGRSRTVRV